MNTFEQIMQSLAGISKDERAKLIDAQKALCICFECPSYTDCAKNSQEVFFAGLARALPASAWIRDAFVRPAR